MPGVMRRNSAANNKTAVFVKFYFRVLLNIILDKDTSFFLSFQNFRVYFF